MIQITQTLSLNEDELTFQYTRAAGPGGQNVNRVKTAVRLTLSLAESSLPNPVKRRFKTLFPGRLSGDDVVHIEAKEFRTQKANREAAVARLVDLLRQAATVPKRRRPTKPSRGSKERRLTSKKKRGSTKRDRKYRGDE
jgi:ribosome-associated protein